MVLSLFVFAVAAGTSFGQGKFPPVEKMPFGKLADGREVFKYTLINDTGMKAEVINYGAILTNLYVKDKTGTLADV
ncbi:MAG TPA: galactose-1-epimerase, partial [Bacteroidota bacterium]|nr:galactose-1-epimerase [Bacteroidota bacterium]